MIETKDLSPKAKKVALREFANSLNTELESAEEIDSALKIIEVLADMPKDQAIVVLAMAKLATLPPYEGVHIATQIIRGDR